MHRNPLTPLRLAALSAGAALLLGSPRDAQSIVTLLVSGDPVLNAPGVLQDIQDVNVNDNGDWIARIRNTVGSSTQDVVVIDGGAVLIEGDILPFPSGAALELANDVDLDGQGNPVWTLDTDVTASMDVLLYWNLVPLAQEGTAATGTGFPAGTVWKSFTGFQTSTDDEVLIVGKVDAPNVGGPNDDSLVLLTHDNTGLVVDQQLVLLDDDPIPGSFDKVLQIGGNAGAHDIAVGAGGHWIAYVRANSGSSNDELIMKDSQVIAREQGFGPVPGSLWDKLAGTAVGLNDDGDYVFRGSYAVGTDDPLNALIKNGVPLYNEGDTSQYLAPFAFSDFGTNTPVVIGNNGSVVFYARTTNTDASRDKGYFVNDRYIVQEGVTTSGTNLIATLVSGPNALAMSPSGRYVVFEAFLSDGRDAMFLADLGLVSKMQQCGTAAATLSHVDGLPLLGETLGFEMDGGQDIGVTPLFLVSTAPIAGWPPCGLMTPLGEILIDFSPGLGNPSIVLTGVPYDGSPSEFSVAVPNDTALLGTDFFAQGLFLDFGNQSSAENVRLTNGLEIQLALP